MKVEHQSKRPKRENVDLPWYKPSFLFSSDDKETVGSDAQVNWLKMPWQRSKDEENEIFTTTEDIPTTMHSYNIVEKVKKYLLPPAQEKVVSRNTKNKRRRKMFDNYQLWCLSLKDSEDKDFLEDFKVSADGLKVHWMNGLSSKGTTDVVVPPDFVQEFQQLLSDNEVKFYVKNRNIQHAIQIENPRFNKREQIEMEVMNGHTMTWHHYHSYGDLQSYFSFLRRKFSNNVELIQIGYSFEGRPLTVVKITDYIESKMLPKEPRIKSEKPAIFIQSGAESHEWLNIASASFILNKIVSKIKGNETDRVFIESFDWYFMPLTNPDGVEHSMKYDRLWQKTRSRYFSSSSLWSSP